MKKKIKWILAVMITLITLAGCTGSGKTTPTGQVPLEINNNAEEKLSVYFFWGDGCPHCTTQKPYLEEWKNKYPEIEVLTYETWKNKENAELFSEIAKSYETTAQGVPTTFIGEKNWVGFSKPMAEEMENYIKHCIENECKSPKLN